MYFHQHVQLGRTPIGYITAKAEHLLDLLEGNLGFLPTFRERFSLCLHTFAAAVSLHASLVLGKTRACLSGQLETVGVLCIVYGKCIAARRGKEQTPAPSQLTNLLPTNTSHEVHTPHNANINCLELALDGLIEGVPCEH